MFYQNVKRLGLYSAVIYGYLLLVGQSHIEKLSYVLLEE